MGTEEENNEERTARVYSVNGDVHCVLRPPLKTDGRRFFYGSTREGIDEVARIVKTAKERGYKINIEAGIIDKHADSFSFLI